MASVQHRIADDEHKQQQQREAATKRRTAQWTKKKLTKEQMEALEARRCEKAKKRDEMEGIRTQKIRIFPTTQQKHQLAKAFEACRWVFNRCAEAVNAARRKRKDLSKDLRARFVNVDVWTEVANSVDKEWKDIPYEVRDGALRDAIKAVASADALMDAKAVAAGKDHAQGWHFKFRRKKDTTESLQLRKRQLNSSAPWFAALFGGVADRSTMHSRRPLPAEFATDTRLLHDKRRGRYYLIIALPPSSSQPPLGPEDDSQVLAEPAAMDVDGGEEEEECRLVSIDPGVRTFATCFDPRGFCTKWGEHASSRL